MKWILSTLCVIVGLSALEQGNDVLAVLALISSLIWVFAGERVLEAMKPPKGVQNMSDTSQVEVKVKIHMTPAEDQLVANLFSTMNASGDTSPFEDMKVLLLAALVIAKRISNEGSEEGTPPAEQLKKVIDMMDEHILVREMEVTKNV